MRKRQALIALAAGLVAGPVLAIQPVVRPMPPPNPEVIVPCRTDGAPSAYVPRLLRVTVNGSPTREEPVFLQRPCGALLARAVDLERLRIRTRGKPVVTIDGDRYLNLNQFKSLTYVLDEAAQTLVLEGEPEIFYPTVIDFDPPLVSSPSKVAPGAYLNYGALVSAPVGEGDRTYSGNLGLGVFGSPGVLTSDWNATQFRDVRTVQRVSSTFTRDDEANITSLRVGDLTASDGSVGAGPALAGVQYATNFATRPQMRIAPGEMIEAATRRVATPFMYSEDYLDERRGPRQAFMSSLGTVPYGPVELVNVPTYYNGEYELVLRDAFGGEQRVRQPYFFNRGLLRPGLADFSFEAGVLRRTGDDYRGGFGAASYRRGITPVLTLEGHAEASDAGYAGGGASSWAIPWWGVLTTSAAAASHELADGAGYAGALSLENSYQRLAYALRQECQSAEFILPHLEVAPLQTTACRAFASISGSLPWNDTLSLALSSATIRGRPATRTAQVQYGARPFDGANLTVYAGVSQPSFDRYSAGISFNYSFAALSKWRGGGRDASLLDWRQANLTVDASGSDGRVDTSNARISSNAPLGDGHASLQVGTALTAPSRQNISGAWSGPATIASGAVQSFDGTESYSLGLSSALVWMDGGLYRARPLHSGFAVVRLGEGNGGIRVNNVVTDSDGDAVIEPLLPYFANRLMIDPRDIDPNVRVGNTQMEAVPRFRSGVLLQPKVQRVRSAILRITVRAAGGEEAVLPLGAYGMVAGASDRYPVGEDGEMYIESIGEKASLNVRHRGQDCLLELSLPLPKRSDTIPDLGTFQCDSIHP